MQNVLVFENIQIRILVIQVIDPRVPHDEHESNFCGQKGIFEEKKACGFPSEGPENGLENLAGGQIAGRGANFAKVGRSLRKLAHQSTFALAK